MTSLIVSRSGRTRLEGLLELLLPHAHLKAMEYYRLLWPVDSVQACIIVQSIVSANNTVFIPICEDATFNLHTNRNEIMVRSYLISICRSRRQSGLEWNTPG